VVGLARPSVKGDHDVARFAVARDTDVQGRIRHFYIEFSDF